MGPLIDTTELAGSLGRVKIFDIRWSLTDPGHGRNAYLAGHLPGAVFVDLDRDLAAPPSLSGRHPLPPVDDFATTLGRLGVTPEDEVVVYDDSGGSVAARMWWMLRSIGHEKTRLLDGGFQAWVGRRLPVETGEETPSPSEYPVPRRFEGVVGWEELGGRTVIDGRAPERFRGETEPVDPKAGHIPGAINIPLSSNLAGDGRFRSPGELAELYAGVDDHPVVYCGSGVNACHLALALTVAGKDLPEVYVGSFSEWSRRGFPVETGP